MHLCIHARENDEDDAASLMTVAIDFVKTNSTTNYSFTPQKRKSAYYIYMKVGQHYYPTISKMRTRAFGALTGV